MLSGWFCVFEIVIWIWIWGWFWTLDFKVDGGWWLVLSRIYLIREGLVLVLLRGVAVGMYFRIQSSATGEQRAEIPKLIVFN